MRDTFAPPAPDDAPLNYFERPVLKRPQWGGEVIAYLFLGGIMGGCGIIAMLADRSNERNLALSSKLSAFALASVCPVVLISHLGKPK
ncbi:MAG: nitrite reductase, partial [Candidatus Eremiobacteraeota bacterium]|nr:nitrite reductase [Candidatus Eremiobacteraeota bacterium]